MESNKRTFPTMKILMLNNYYYVRGGSEKVLLGEMELLQGNGHEVAIFTRKFDKNLN